MNEAPPSPGAARTPAAPAAPARAPRAALAWAALVLAAVVAARLHLLDGWFRR